jgi:hypothetical protein
MDLFTTLNNGSLNLARASLLNEETLKLGVATLQSSPGDDQERLRAAIEAMIESHKVPTSTMELPEDLEALTVRHLINIANSYSMPHSGMRKAELIAALRRHARLLREIA